MVVPGGQSLGLTCGGDGITLGPADETGSFDAADDSFFTLTFSEDELSDCAGPTQVTYTFTKVD